MHRAVVVPLVCVALVGCGGTGVQGGAWGPGSSASASGEMNIRAAIPATEAYYADNGTYAGVTLAKLRTTYDSSLEEVRFVEASAMSYCIESTDGTQTWSKRGPAADILPEAC